jgi:NADH-quinone oxidoreductase subunit L
MVTAGVYLIVRSQELYNAAPTVLLLIAIIGAATALYGAVVGQTVSDIKGLLATSTTTQLGFMFLACGLGAYSVAVFHLLAHAFLKSYLFLTAPSILHHLHGRLDPAQKEAHQEAPSTYTVVTLLAGLLVVVPLAMELVGGSGQLLGWGSTSWLLLAGALLAVFSAGHYAYSLTRKAFVDHAHTDHGDDPAHAHGGHAHTEDADGAMLPAGPVVWPLALIALAAAAGMALQILPGGLDGSWFRSLIAPVIAEAENTADGGAAALRWTLMVLLVAMVVYAWFTAVFLGRFRSEASVSLRQWRSLYVAALNRFWIDALTQKLVVGNVHRVGRVLDRFDTEVIDRMVGMPGYFAVAAGRLVAWLDTHVRGTAERGPAAFAQHLGQFATLIERHLIGGIERSLHSGSSELARLGSVVENALAKPAVAVAVIAVVVLAAFLGVR